MNETLVPDWREPGHPGAFTPLGVLLHHTAGPATGNLPSLRVVRDGRADLPGPLAQLMLARDGTWVPIAAGLAWHAGEGSAPWVPGGAGNRYLIGIEAESVGTRDDWSPAQREAYPLGVAALCRHLGAPPPTCSGIGNGRPPAGSTPPSGTWTSSAPTSTRASVPPRSTPGPSPLPVSERTNPWHPSPCRSTPTARSAPRAHGDERQADEAPVLPVGA